ncbi:MAG: hypothetical protein QGI81_02975 [Pseudomonadales bacterium]|nr:hypothetical protein [Pseudomonadales bacterium]MDP6469948.1 hypothetical protein [Pseudomonadales bacterium]
MICLSAKFECTWETPGADHVETLAALFSTGALLDALPEDAPSYDW